MDDPKLAKDLGAKQRFQAAVAAALAGCGMGNDKPPLDAKARGRCRQLALAWLREDLTEWTKLLEGGKAADRARLLQVLPRWQRNPDLAGLREKKALEKLPEAERKAWSALWDDVDKLLEKAARPEVAKKDCDHKFACLSGTQVFGTPQARPLWRESVGKNSAVCRLPNYPRTSLAFRGTHPAEHSSGAAAVSWVLGNYFTGQEFRPCRAFHG